MTIRSALVERVDDLLHEVVPLRPIERHPSQGSHDPSQGRAKQGVLADPGALNAHCDQGQHPDREVPVGRMGNADEHVLGWQLLRLQHHRPADEAEKPTGDGAHHYASRGLREEK